MKKIIFILLLMFLSLQLVSQTIDDDTIIVKKDMSEEYSYLRKYSGTSDFENKSEKYPEKWRDGLKLYKKFPQIIKEKNMSEHHLHVLRFNLIAILFSPYDYCITLNSSPPTKKEVDFLIDEYLKLGTGNNQVNAMILSAPDNIITPEKKLYFSKNAKYNSEHYQNSIELTLKDMLNTEGIKNPKKLALQKKVVECLNKIKS